MRRLSPRSTILAGLAALALSEMAEARPAPHRVMPATAKAAGPAMISAANPLAVEAGLKVLRAGGSAVDAAVAIQAVLGLVEPQSSGLGGGAFMMLYRPGRAGGAGRLTAFDGREVAPRTAGPDLFLGPDGKPLKFVDAVLSGRSTGVPGAIAMLASAHREHGRLPWRGLFDDAIRLADQGFTVSPRLAGMIAGPFPQAKAPDAVAYFSKPDGTRYLAGEVLRNPAYAASLRRLAAEGLPALLTGKIAADIVARTHEGASPGGLTLADLAAYKPVEREALCEPYHAYRVCAPPAPGGGPGLTELMGLLADTDIARRGPADMQAWTTFAQASRLAYADRDRYEGDPAFVRVPMAGLLQPSYLAARAALVPTLGPAAPDPGVPVGALARGPDHTAEPGGTTHFVIVDPQGEVVSMTTTVESVFGSGRMVDGFFLNNQLTDFSFSPTNADGTPAANAVAAGKRPRSSMSPTIVLDGRGRFVMAVGSPGGNQIVAYVAKALVGVIDWGLTMQQAAALPNVVGRGAVVSVEEGRFTDAQLAQMKAAGLPVGVPHGENSGVHGVVVRAGDVLEGGADPRREGVARSL